MDIRFGISVSVTQKKFGLKISLALELMVLVHAIVWLTIVVMGNYTLFLIMELWLFWTQKATTGQW